MNVFGGVMKAIRITDVAIGIKPCAGHCNFNHLRFKLLQLIIFFLCELLQFMPQQKVVYNNHVINEMSVTDHTMNCFIFYQAHS
jgi:hypothetical protein